ncbi:MAG: hypothetical protein LAO21_17845 [Acidobacteriia bacterium]|nr:hypothetical protein [Terriglobia bacterium]
MNLRDCFALPDNTLPPASRTAVESSRFMPALREALAKGSKAIKWDAVSDVLAKKILETLDVPLLDILLPAWKKYREVEEFADPGKYPPADTYLVSLAEHSVKSEHHPCVEVLFKGAKLTQIDFTLTAEFTLEGFVLQIQGGRIKAIRPGTIKGQGSLALETTVVLEKDFGSIELPGMLQLGEGIPLR